ncbi:MAG: polymer-forming cytoskeletal protein [Candidatus Falkowbacteria bacterium]
MSKKLFLKIGLFALIALVLPFSAARAFEVRSGDSVYIPKDQIISGNFYTAASNLTIDGQILGDVICAGQNVVINGKVDGDVICAAQSLNINGEVNGNVRVAGNNIDINGAVARNVNLMSATALISANAKVGRDILLAVDKSEFRGTVGGSIYGAANNLLVAGTVGDGINVKIGQYNGDKNTGLIIADGAKVAGNVTYSSEQEAKINKDNVGGQIVRQAESQARPNLFLAYIMSQFYAIFSALLVGLIIVSLWRKTTIKITDRIKTDHWASIGWGFILFFVSPIICIILALTVIGIPLALILAGLWLLANFACKLLTAIFIGRLIFKKLKQKESEKLLLEMTVGVFVCWMIFSIPILGWIASLWAICMGCGASWLVFRKIEK